MGGVRAYGRGSHLERRVQAWPSALTEDHSQMAEPDSVGVPLQLGGRRRQQPGAPAGAAAAVRRRADPGRAAQARRPGPAAGHREREQERPERRPVGRRRSRPLGTRRGPDRGPAPHQQAAARNQEEARQRRQGQQDQPDRPVRGRPVIAATVIGEVRDVSASRTATSSPPTTAPPRSRSRSGKSTGSPGAGTGG